MTLSVDHPLHFPYMEKAAALVSKTLGILAPYVVAGRKTKELDQLAYEFIQDHQDASPAFKGYAGFPATLCISVNEEIVHGIPGDYLLKEGDVVTIDCGVSYKGHFGDAAYTFPVGNISKELVNLLSSTKKALYLGIDQLLAGNRVGDIGAAIETYIAEQQMQVIAEYGGHGIGRHLHEDPHIPNFGKRGTGKKIKENGIYCIEPIVTLGKKAIVKQDAWRVITQDKAATAHFEHTVAVLLGKPKLLTTFNYIEIEQKKVN